MKLWDIFGLESNRVTCLYNLCSSPFFQNKSNLPLWSKFLSWFRVTYLLLFSPNYHLHVELHIYVQFFHLSCSRAENEGHENPIGVWSQEFCAYELLDKMPKRSWTWPKWNGVVPLFTRAAQNDVVLGPCVHSRNDTVPGVRLASKRRRLDPRLNGAVWLFLK